MTTETTTSEFAEHCEQIRATASAVAGALIAAFAETDDAAADWHRAGALRQALRERLKPGFAKPRDEGEFIAAAITTAAYQALETCFGRQQVRHAARTSREELRRCRDEAAKREAAARKADVDAEAAHLAEKLRKVQQLKAELATALD